MYSKNITLCLAGGVRISFCRLALGQLVSINIMIFPDSRVAVVAMP